MRWLSSIRMEDRSRSGVEQAPCVPGQRHDFVEIQSFGSGLRCEAEDSLPCRVEMKNPPFEVGGNNAGCNRSDDMVGHGGQTLRPFDLLAQTTPGESKTLGKVGNQNGDEDKTDDVDQQLGQDPGKRRRHLNPCQIGRNREKVEHHQVDQESVGDRRESRKNQTAPANDDCPSDDDRKVEEGEGGVKAPGEVDQSRDDADVAYQLDDCLQFGGEADQVEDKVTETEGICGQDDAVEVFEREDQRGSGLNQENAEEKSGYDDQPKAEKPADCYRGR